MRRRKTEAPKAYRSYDFLLEVDSKRLQLIGAITLAWNWIEGAIDASLGIGIEAHPDMWVEITSRINGMDGKIALLRKSLDLDGYPPLPNHSDLFVRRALNAVETYKKLRDGIIHARLVHPENVVADTVQRRGLTDEVLISEHSLTELYGRLSLLVRETDQLVLIYFHRWQLSEQTEKPVREELAERLVAALYELSRLQQTREALPPLPDFPAWATD